MQKRAITVLLLMSVLSLLGCTHVQPWEKGMLAEETMKPGGTIPETGVFDSHVYYSREAIQGGTGVGGGGCGCN